LGGISARFSKDVATWFLEGLCAVGLAVPGICSQSKRIQPEARTGSCVYCIKYAHVHGNGRSRRKELMQTLIHEDIIIAGTLLLCSFVNVQCCYPQANLYGDNGGAQFYTRLSNLSNGAMLECVVL
jgi:hypothetical protein